MEKEAKKVEEDEKGIEEKKMRMELHIADIVNDHKTKKDATQLKMRKIKRYALDKDICNQYAFGEIIILVAILFILFCLFRCSR